MSGDLDQIVGIYNADGGLVGETRYVLGKFVGTSHCSLCDITHSPVRRKPEWDAMVSDLGIPVDLVHRNEVPDVVVSLLEKSELPVVVGVSGREARVLISAEELQEFEGSVAEFARALRRKIEMTP